MPIQPTVYTFSTVKNKSPTEAFAAWIEQVRRNIATFDVRTDERDKFFGSFATRKIGPLRFAAIEAAHQHGTHHARAGGDALDRMDLAYLQRGRMLVRQNGIELNIGEGDFVLIDYRDKFEFIASSCARGFNVSFPMHWLRSWLPDPEACAMRVVSPERGRWANLMRTILNEVSANLNTEGCSMDSLLIDEIGGALALVFYMRHECTSSKRAKMYSKLLGMMRSELSNSTLTPRSVAKANGISVRSVHTAFAAANTTFGRELRRMRLDKVRRLLEDSRYRGHTIGDIAQLCGYNDPAYLARCFKETFGRSPSASRFLWRG